MYVARTTAVLSAGLLGAALLTGCAVPSSAPVSGSGHGTVAAAFYPLAWASERVAGDRWTVDNLTSPGGEPHDLELSVNQTLRVSDADLVVYESGFQPAVDAAVDRTASGAVLDAARVVDLKAFAEEDAHHRGHAGHDSEGGHEGHDHADHGELDPHFWLDPTRMADLGDAVAERLAELEPRHAATYRANAAALRADLERLDREYADGLADCRRNTVVVNHDAFGYLDRYGLEIHPILGITPEAEPSAGTLADLRRVIAEDGVTTVFTETLASPKSAESLARDAGVRTAVLDPVEGLPSADSSEDYLSLMRANLAALEEANGC
ncbi:metal ABC transporter substrate-binding protein [Nocardioides rotundus]|uniref:metal ABC transporter substrate-binding protein n=1 Tax=Nocardioides rotundus TaxID=1774216 RepID=UPI001CBBC0AF|nr:metal ABC transporter substrate-binding protein [Nocardioides rotundus]UAL31055.1 metal ABC transporter substrate-binding protein [Nocardioides rotundus]